MRTLLNTLKILSLNGSAFLLGTACSFLDRVHTHADDGLDVVSVDSTFNSYAFDDSACRLPLRWIQLGEKGQLNGWRALPAYVSLQEWANTPERREQFLQIDKKFQDAAANASPAQQLPPELNSAREVLEHSDAWVSELTGWRIPNARYYMPNTDVKIGKVRLALYLPEPWIVTPSGDLLVDAAAVDASASASFAEAAAELLYESALDRLLPPPSLKGSSDSIANFEERLLHSLQREGVETYVKAQGLSYERFESGPGDYTLSLDRDVVAQHFSDLGDVLRPLNVESSASDIARVETDLAAFAAKDHVYAIIGAYIAARIETEQGHTDLVATLARGPLAFWDAYRNTKPGATVLLRLPSERSAEAPAEPLSH